jgi:hypothetical protein
MKKKLNITAIKVQSFVTELNNAEAQTVQGGTGNSFNPVCESQVAACQTAACSVVVACIPPPPPPTLRCVTFDVTCEF